MEANKSKKVKDVSLILPMGLSQPSCVTKLSSSLITWHLKMTLVSIGWYLFTKHVWTLRFAWMTLRLTDNVAVVPRATLLKLRQNVGLKGQRCHTEEEIPDAISWNRNETKREGLSETQTGQGGGWSFSGRWGFPPTWLCRHSPVLRFDFLRQSNGFPLNLMQLIRRLSSTERN